MCDNLTIAECISDNDGDTFPDGHENCGNRALPATFPQVYAQLTHCLNKIKIKKQPLVRTAGKSNMLYY